MQQRACTPGRMGVPIGNGTSAHKVCTHTAMRTHFKGPVPYTQLKNGEHVSLIPQDGPTRLCECIQKPPRKDSDHPATSRG